MTLNQLRIFLAVADERHFSRAAQQLHITQSAVSTQVKLLEKELNTRLFDRLGRKTHLTEAGRLLKGRAKGILDAVEQVYQTMDELEGLRRGHIALGASTTPGTYILPQILGCYREKHPCIELEYHIANTQDVEEMVLQNQVDFGIVGGHLNQSELVREPWLMDELIAVASPDHSLVRQTSIALSELQDGTLVLRSQGSATRQVIASEFAARGLTLKPAMELRDPESVKQMVVAGWGLTICSKHGALCELASNRLVRLDVPELPFLRELSIVSHRDKHLSAAASALLSELRVWLSHR